MKKIIAAACFSLAAFGFSTTSSLAAGNVAAVSASAASMQKDAIALNYMLATKKVISMDEWYANVLKIVNASTEQETKAVYDALVYKVAHTPFYQ